MGLKIYNKYYAYYHGDGIADMQIGLFHLITGISMVINSLIMFYLAFLVLLVFIPVKRNIVAPRIQNKNLKKIKRTSYFIHILIAFFLIGFIYSFVGLVNHFSGNEIFENYVMYYFHGNMLKLLVFLFTIVGIIIGLMFRFFRILIYSILFLFFYAIGILLPFSHYYPFILIGTISLITGIIIFIRFVKVNTAKYT